MRQALLVALVAALATTSCHAIKGPESQDAELWNGRELLQAAPAPWVLPSDLRDCGELLRDSLAPPPQAIVAAVFTSNGTENYTCMADGDKWKWTVLGSRKDMYYAGSGLYAGFMFTEAHDIENARYVFTDPTNTTEWGDAVKDNQVTYDVMPLDPANRKWWRRPLVRSNGIAAGTVLVVKMDSVGGNAPNEGMCDESQAGEMLYEYMTNTYTIYACKNMPAFPYKVPKCRPPKLEGMSSSFETDNLRTVWEVEAKGTRNWTCTAGAPAFHGTVCDVAGGGKCFYTPPAPGMDAGDVGYFVLQRGTSATYWLDTLQNSTAASPEAALDWAAWPVSKMQGEPQCEYIARWATSGGVTPASCGATPEGGEITVPFTAKYSCLQCT